MHLAGRESWQHATGLFVWPSAKKPRVFPGALWNKAAFVCYLIPNVQSANRPGWGWQANVCLCASEPVSYLEISSAARADSSMPCCRTIITNNIMVIVVITQLCCSHTTTTHPPHPHLCSHTHTTTQREDRCFSLSQKQANSQWVQICSRMVHGWWVRFLTTKGEHKAGQSILKKKKTVVVHSSLSLNLCVMIW